MIQTKVRYRLIDSKSRQNASLARAERALCEEHKEQKRQKPGYQCEQKNAQAKGKTKFHGLSKRCVHGCFYRLLFYAALEGARGKSGSGRRFDRLTTSLYMPTDIGQIGIARTEGHFD